MTHLSLSKKLQISDFAPEPQTLTLNSSVLQSTSYCTVDSSLSSIWTNVCTLCLFGDVPHFNVTHKDMFPVFDQLSVRVVLLM